MSNIAFMPGILPCELCLSGVARMVVDDVWVCEACLEVLGVPPLPVRIEPVRVAELPSDARFKPPLLEIIESLLRDVK